MWKEIERKRMKIEEVARRMSPMGWIRGNVLTYYWLHFGYFIVITLIAGGLIKIWQREWRYIDCLFTAVSAMTCTGLTTINFAIAEIPTQIIVYFLIMIGNTVLMSLPALVISRYRKGRVESTEEREQLRRSAMTRLFFIVILYFIISVAIFTCITLIYFASWDEKREILEKNKVSWQWFSFFHSISAMGNAGFALLPDSLVQFSTTSYVLQYHVILILLGNTLFPISLYLICLFLYSICSLVERMNGRMKRSKEVYDYLLSNPRNCFTHLYSFDRTMLLATMVLVFNWLQIILTLILDWDGALGGYGGVFKIENSIFQSVSTRTAGFNSLILPNEAPAILFLYVMLMYLSSYPLVISIQQTAHVLPSLSSPSPSTSYYDDDLSDNTSSLSSLDESSLFYKQHLSALSQVISPATSSISMYNNNKTDESKGRIVEGNPQQDGLFQVVYTDLMIVSVGILLICIGENTPLTTDPNSSIFQVIFEVVSGYGTVGLSLGYGNEVYSFAGSFCTFSKLVMIAVMLFGRHRGLPSNRDLVFGGLLFPTPQRALPPSPPSSSPSSPHPSLSSPIFDRNLFDNNNNDNDNDNDNNNNDEDDDLGNDFDKKVDKGDLPSTLKFLPNSNPSSVV